MREGSRGMETRLKGRRRAILEEHGLVYAPREIQRAFWSGYNSRRRAGVRVGDLVSGMIVERATRASGELARLMEAWKLILPEGLAGRTRVESFAGGCLRVVVDSSATRFVLSRQIGERIVAALNESCSGAAVTRIEYRIGRLHGKQPERGEEQQRE